jgi:plasmid replication initiation protein
MATTSELVVMSNKLIEASYRLTLIEQQIILYAICRCREEQLGLTPDTLITIRALDFAEQFGTNKAEVYRQLRTAMDTLYERTVRILDTDPVSGKRRKADHRWISSKYQIEGEEDSGTGYIQLQFTSFIIPYITRLESAFTTYRLEQIGKMTSIHAIRMYGLLVQYLPIKKREIEVAWLKHTLQLEGQYSAIKDFKKWVLDVAVDQINTHSDIRVQYTPHKTGRAVTHLLFDIRAKPKPRPASAQRKLPGM